jgi:hypothetical protein
MHVSLRISQLKDCEALAALMKQLGYEIDLESMKKN